jgi:hypothetical protein
MTNTLKNKKMTKDKVKNIVTANVGEGFLMVEETKAIANSESKVSKFVIVGRTIMCKKALNDDFTEYELNDKFVVRRNSPEIKKPGEVIFDEDVALDLVNELNEKELKKVRNSIEDLKKIEEALISINKIYSDKNSLSYDKKGTDINLTIVADKIK